MSDVKGRKDVRSKAEILAQASYAFGQGEGASVDDGCKVARAEGGSWVQVWHWIPDDEVEV